MLRRIAAVVDSAAGREAMMMERALDWVRGYAQLAWWDGSCLDLRLHRFTDFLDFVAGAPEPAPAHLRRGTSA
ncbi:hypothetical protein ASF28_08030 [Methylobacterium sp. Leaf99]|nr:hypothetical protein ASF28_08030 [Methylobacterium sp. Leaf99]TXM74000.1 hypothetical protein FV218_10455 [Methylobacterium sp. WL69]